MLAGLSLSIALAVCSQSAGSHERAPATYAADRCGGPLDHWSPQRSEFYELSVLGRLEVGPRRLTWNNTPTRNLRPFLVEAAGLTPRPNVEVVFQAGTDCRRVKAIRHEVDTILKCGPAQRCVEYSDAEWKRTLPPPIPR